MIGDLSPHDVPHDVELGLEPIEPACGCGWPHAVELGLEPPAPDCGYCDDRGCSECDPEPDPEPDPEAA
jgi:hypothetical protein